MQYSTWNGCDSRDPLWINARLKHLINDKKILVPSNKNTNLFEEFKLRPNKIDKDDSDIIPEYLINLMFFTYHGKHSNFKNVSKK